MSETNQQIILPERVVEIFKPYKAQLVKLREDNESQTFDYASKAGRKEARSHIFKFRQSKSAVEKKRKEEKASILEAGRQIDSVAKEIMGELESMIDVHLKPVEEAEAAEERRLDVIREKIESISKYAECQGQSAHGIMQRIEELEKMEFSTDKYEDLLEDALRAQGSALDKLKISLEAQKEVEAQQVEIERMRKEAAERNAKEKKEREEREAAEKIRRAIEENELIRANKIRKNIELIKLYATDSIGKPSELIEEMIYTLGTMALTVEEYGDSLSEAQSACAASLSAMKANLNMRISQDERAREFEAMKAREAKSAEEKRLAEQKLADEKASRERAEREAEDAKRRESERLEREAREKKEREAAEKKRIAVEEEAARVAKEKRQQINSDIRHHFLKHCSFDTAEQCADAVAATILSGDMPHVKVVFSDDSQPV